MAKRKTLGAMVESCSIFAQYLKDGMDASFPFEAYHDEIYGPINLEQVPVDSEVGKRLIELGWNESDGLGVWLT